MKPVSGLGVVALFFIQLACGGGSGGTAAPTTAIAFCEQSENYACEQAYACTPTAMQDANFKAFWGTSVSDCKSMSPDDCASTKCGTPYDPAKAATCLSKMMTDLKCDVIDPTKPLPVECDQACPQ
jgi:hypothetical protein